MLLTFWIAAILFGISMIGMGIAIRLRHQKESSSDVLEDFWIASRKYSGWRLAASLTAGWLMLGWLGYGMSMVYSMGISGLWTLFLPWFILCFIVILMVPHVRKFRTVSLPEALSQRFGPGLRPVIAVASIFVFVSWTGAETYMAGILVSPFLRISASMGMVLVALPVMIYSFFGGFRASIITDLIQFFLAALFVTALAVVGLHQASTITGGHILSTLAATPTKNYGPGSMFNFLACGIAMPIILLIAYLPGWLIEQDLLLRIQAANSLDEAKKGAIWGLVFITLFVIIMPVIIALAAIIIFPSTATASTTEIGADATGIIAALILKYFPSWAQVLMLIGILASQMSTIDNFANIVALPMTHDLVRPMFLSKASLPTITRFSRIFSGGAVILGLIYGLNNNSLMDIYTLSSGVLTAAIAIPAFAMFIGQVNYRGALWSSIAGLVATTVFYYFEYKVWNHTFTPQWLADTSLGYIIVGIGASLLGLLIGSMTGKRSATKELAAIADYPLEGVSVFNLEKVGAVVVITILCLSYNAYADDPTNSAPKTLLGNTGIAVSADSNISSKYVSRGILYDPEPVVQSGFYLTSPELTAGGIKLGKLKLSFWDNAPLGSDDRLQSAEYDYIADYTYDALDYLTLSVGHTYYNFPAETVPDGVKGGYSREGYVGFGLPKVFLTPSVYYYYDYGKKEDGGGQGSYTVLNLAYSKPFTVKGINASLDLNGHAGYNNKQYYSGNGGDVGLGAGITVPLTTWLTIKPNANYSIPLGNLRDKNNGDQKNQFYYGVYLCATF